MLTLRDQSLTHCGMQGLHIVIGTIDRGIQGTQVLQVDLLKLQQTLVVFRLYLAHLTV